MHEYENLIGKVFGSFTVLRRSYTKTDGNRWWILSCACGNTVETSTSRLNEGRHSLCKCTPTPGKSVRRHWKNPGHASFYSKYDDYKRGAKSRNIAFNLTFEQFKKIAIKSCLYCGTGPKDFSTYWKRKGSVEQEIVDRSIIKINGIDRIDNRVGYVVENCCPCCSICNTMKLCMSKEEFVNHINLIHAHQAVKPR
jgi:hypothetical protein